MTALQTSLITFTTFFSLFLGWSWLFKHKVMVLEQEVNFVDFFLSFVGALAWAVLIYHI